MLALARINLRKQTFLHTSLSIPVNNLLTSSAFSTSKPQDNHKPATPPHHDKKSAAEAKKKSLDLQILKELSRHLWPSKEINPKASEVKIRVVASLSLLFASKIVNIYVPFLFKDIVDQFEMLSNLTATPETLLVSSPIWLVLGYGMARSTAAGFGELRNAIFSKVAHGTIREVSGNIFKHLHELDQQFHLERNTGMLSRTLDRGTRSINFTLTSLLFNVFPTSLEVLLVGGILTYKLGAMYAVVTTSTVLAYTLFTVKVSDWRTAIRKEMNRQETIASGKVIDSLVNYETVKLFTNERYELARYDDSLHRFQEASILTQQSLSFLNFGQNAIFSVGLTCLMGMTAQAIVQGQASIGDLVLVNGLLFQLSIPLNFIGSVYRELRQATQDMQAMFQLRQLQPSVKNTATPIPYVFPKEFEGKSIDFQGVTFAYPSNPTRAIFSDLHLSIPLGQKVAIVGSSGSGKSTLYRLLFRLYDVQQGSILFHSTPLPSLEVGSVRQAIGVVPQDIVLFNDTLQYNIQYGNFAASREQFDKVLQLSRLTELVHRLPQGLQTIVGDRGLKLSGGEKQRVAIARCLLKDAPILILDEATSALDTESEQAIQQAIQSLPGQHRTVVIIAHRLSTVREADCIFVLHEGKVVEQGKHDELVQLQGRYAELVAKMMTNNNNNTNGNGNSI